jgi:hypothetical protein
MSQPTDEWIVLASYDNLPGCPHAQKFIRA